MPGEPSEKEYTLSQRDMGHSEPSRVGWFVVVPFVVVGGGWRWFVVVGGGWWWLVVVGGGWWWLVVVGDGWWWFVVVCGGWWLMVGGGWWWLVVVRGGSWWLVVAMVVSSRYLLHIAATPCIVNAFLVCLYHVLPVVSYCT